MSNLTIVVVDAIIKQDWEFLIKFTQSVNISTDDCEYYGEYETDARHTYPNRLMLINRALKRLRKNLKED